MPKFFEAAQAHALYEAARLEGQAEVVRCHCQCHSGGWPIGLPPGMEQPGCGPKFGTSELYL